MKKILLLFICFLFYAITANAQEKKPEKHAEKIADAMKDSLNLNKKQRDEIYTINMDLYNKKTIARKASTDRAIVGKELQRIENTRDSLYKKILAEKEYDLYKQEKRNLVKKY